MVSEGITNADLSGRFFGTGSSSFVPRVVDMGSDHGEDLETIERYQFLRTQVYRTFFDRLTVEGQFYRAHYGEEILPKDWRDRGFKATIPPTAYNAVQAASDHILSTPDIFVPERPSSDPDKWVREQTLAELKAQALEYWWAHIEAHQSQPVTHGKTNLIRDGKIILKKEIDFERLDNGVRTAAFFPWKVKLVSNYAVMEDYRNPQNPNYVYEASEMSVEAAMQDFPEARGTWRRNRKKDDMVRVVEYWEKPSGTSKGKRQIFIENERVLNKTNPYWWVCGVDDNGVEQYDGYCPYFIADSMWGDGDAAAPAHERYVGIIRYACSVIEAEARQLTAADAQLRVGTFPVMLMTGIEEDNEKPLKVAPGVKLFIEDKDTQAISILEWPRMDPLLFNMIGRVHQYANELAKFESLGGMPQRGVDTATEAQQNFMNASSKLSGPIAALRALFQRINYSVLCDIEYIIEAPVTLMGNANDMPGSIVLRPEDIEGFHDTMVELKTTDEAALNRQNMQSWLNALQVLNAQGPNLDAEYAMTMAGIKNPKQRRARARAERFENDPRTYELQYAEWMQGRGPLGAMLAEGIVMKLATGAPADEGDRAAPAGAGMGPGGFPAVPGMESNRNPETAPQTPAGQDIRATAFGQALADGVGV